MANTSELETTINSWHCKIGAAYSAIQHLTNSGLTAMDLNLAYCALCGVEEQLGELFKDMEGSNFTDV
jgi:hypothetical protein